MQYHFIRPSTFVPQTVVPKMNSLPYSVLRAADKAQQGIAFTRDFGIATWDETGKLILSSWLPAFEDLEAEDWRILEDE
jgi:cbb3-type cytochrome oxidase cytochrome c subunit